MPETTLTLLVKSTGNGDRFTTHIYVNDDLVTSNRTLSVDASQEQRALSERYLALFEQRGLPLVERAALDDFGRGHRAALSHGRSVA